ncbi:efflux RND transporter periplasmic adaptor subunit [Clostridium sp. CS001]|uniref:efflux RND transporter periplasmic adaptor subunit n=1 Tax=Clostridium sp. CS001 TaxID=2880648 RepID=UPI001CF4815F|nr:efflux RND transporter periplasmic adaptor subunit [Clostridium sp. CS001]MCB2291214.1 efflux RND transporter periplasmic adaptor subunit [Clostridium sp. CS001]
MKKKVIISSLIIVGVLSGAFFISEKKNNNKITTVKTSIVQLGELKSYISTTATVKSKNSKMYYGLQAKIKKVNVTVGDNVKIGDILVTYEEQDLGSTVSQAQIQYDNAVLSKKDLYNQNESIKNKITDLGNEIVILEKSINPADKAKAETLRQQKNALSPISNEKLKQADNAVKLSEISLSSAKQRVAENKSTIIAENAGVVTDLNAIEGSIGSGMQAVVVVQDLVNLKATASLGKYDATKVKIGQEVTIKSGNNIYKGSVLFIDPAAKKMVGVTGSETTLGVEILITDNAPALKIDFDVDIDILVEKVANAVKIPSEALKVEKGGKNLVYTIEGNIVHEKNVSIGAQSDTEVQIIQGVKSGEKVILNPSTLIKEGIRVKEALAKD